MNLAIQLRKATEDDLRIIHYIQVKSFAQLLLKYEDFESSPAAEGLDDIRQRFRQPFTDYYLIMLDDQAIGMLRVCDFGEHCRLSPLCILPEYQGRGYAQMAILLMESLYPKAHLWQLDTIAQEAKLRHLYEKMGYRKIEKTEHIKEGMELVYYEKPMC